MLAAADDTTVPESKKLSDNEIIAQSMVFLFAGHETTSTVLSFACYHLAVSPEIQEKLQQEIDSAWSDECNQMLSYETIHQLPYLDMVISETLRLYPPGKAKGNLAELESGLVCLYISDFYSLQADSVNCNL